MCVSLLAWLVKYPISCVSNFLCVPRCVPLLVYLAMYLLIIYPTSYDPTPCCHLCIVHVTLPVRPNLCLSHSLIIQLRVYPAHVSLTTCVFHSACVLPRVFYTPCVFHFVRVPLRVYTTPCISHSVHIPLRVCFALRVFHCECGGVPLRMCSISCVFCSVTPCVFHFKFNSVIVSNSLSLLQSGS